MKELKKPEPVKSPDVDVFKRETYRIGDGEARIVRRPGSDLSKYKSFGYKC